MEEEMTYRSREYDVLNTCMGCLVGVFLVLAV